MAPDKLVSTLPVPMSADLMFGPISIKKMIPSQYHDASYVDIRRWLNEGVALLFGDNES